MSTVLPSQSDIRGSGYTAVSALRNNGGKDVPVQSSNILGEKSLPNSTVDPNNSNKANDNEIQAHDAKNWQASNAWVNTVNKRTLTLGPHWDQLRGLLQHNQTVYRSRVKKHVSFAEALAYAPFLV